MLKPDRESMIRSWLSFTSSLQVHEMSLEDSKDGMVEVRLDVGVIQARSDERPQTLGILKGIDLKVIISQHSSQELEETRGSRSHPSQCRVQKHDIVTRYYE